MAEDFVNIGFVLTADFSLLAFTGFIDALRELDDHAPITKRRYCSWAVLGEQESSVRASCGVSLPSWRPYTDPESYDYIVVIGGRAKASVEERAIGFLQDAADANVRLIGVDTGTFVLARAGLMDGHVACVHWYHYHEYLEEFPHLRATCDQIFLDSDSRLTCAGGTCSIDLAAYLIAKIWGPVEASRVIALMGLEQMRGAQHHQAPYFAEAPIVHDPNVRRAIQLMETSCFSPQTIDQIANQLCISARQLERAFQRELGLPPQEFSRRLRLRRGHWLLSNTPRSIAQIAYDCGFADSSHFTRHFKRAFGTTPSLLRLAERARVSP